MTENAINSDNIENRDCDVLDFYAADDITPIVLSALKGSEYSDILHSIGLSAIDNGRDSLKKYIYKFLRNYKKLTDVQALKADQLYLSFVQDLYHAYAGNTKHLKNLYSSVKHSIYSWNGTYETDLICIDDSGDDYSILEQLNIKYDVAQGSGDDEILQFAPVIMVRLTFNRKTDCRSWNRAVRPPRGGKWY